MKRLGLILVLTLVMLLTYSMVGCGGEEATPTPKPTIAPTSAPTPTPEPIVLKATVDRPDDHAWSMDMYKFKELIEEYTNGRVTLEVYTGGVLFPMTADWEAVSTGAVDISITAPYFAAIAVPAQMVWYMDGVWESNEHGWAVLQDGQVPKMFHDLSWEAGVKDLGFVPYSSYVIVASADNEISDFTDEEGLRFGVTGPPAPIHLQYGKGVPVSVPVTEIYTSLTRGIIDFMPWDMIGAAEMQVWDYADHAFVYAGIYAVADIWMNQDTWNSLPKEIQDIITTKVIPEVQVLAKNAMEQEESELLELLGTKMKTLHVATEDQLVAAIEFLQDDPKFNEQLAYVGPDILAAIAELRSSK
ncbi:TRAP transporter substrate-binding protein [Chloroflexota bacterium]